MMRFTIATLIAGAGLVSAQSLSSGCKTALTNIVASPDAACLNPSALVTLAIGQQSNTSIVDPINNWLTGLCSQAPCTNETLSAVVTNITTGCNTELSATGFSSSDNSQVISVVQQAYPTVRQAVCLKDTSANQLCVTELLTSIQSSVGTLSITNLVQIIPQIASGSTSIPKNVTCSNCVKQAYNIAKTQFSSLVGDAGDSLASTCGSSFTDGQTPAGIQESASTSAAGSTTKSGGAAASFSVNTLVGVAVSGFVLVSSAFAILA